VYICDTSAVERGLCSQEHFGEFLVNNSTRPGSIFTKAINLAEPKPYKYYIKETDYYCVATFGMGDQVQYSAIVEWRNAFGELNAAEYPKLPFYGGLAIVYALIGALWGFLYFQHRSDVLPIQVWSLYKSKRLIRIILPRLLRLCWLRWCLFGFTTTTSIDMGIMLDQGFSWSSSQ